MRRRIRITPVLFLALQLSATISTAQADGTGAEPGIAKFNELSKRSLILATTGESFSDQFQFELRAYGKFKDVERREGFRLIVERWAARFAVLFLSGEGIPIGLFDDGRFLLLDPNQPGRFQALEGWGLHINLMDCPAETDEVKVKFGFNAGTGNSRVTLNLNPFLELLFKERTQLEFNSRTRMLCRKKENGSVNSVVLSEDLSNFPITAISFSGREGEGVAVTNLQIGRPPVP